MLMHAVAGIDDWYVEMLGHHQRRAGGRMPHDDAVRTHCPQRIACIDERLTFFDARSGGENESSPGSQSLCSELKGSAGTSRRFVKQKYHALSAQQRTLLLRIHAARQLQQTQNLFRLE